MRDQNRYYIVRDDGLLLQNNGWKYDAGTENAMVYKRIQDAIRRAETTAMYQHRRMLVMDEEGREVYRTREG